MPIIVKGQILSASEVNKAAFDRAADSDFAKIRRIAESKAAYNAIVHEKRKRDDRLISYKESAFLSDMLQSDKD